MSRWSQKWKRPSYLESHNMPKHCKLGEKGTIDVTDYMNFNNELWK